MNIIEEYRDRLKRGQEVHAKKFSEMRDARQMQNQKIPESMLDNTNEHSGNSQYSSVRSAYLHPIGFAVVEKIMQDLTANPFRFEWEGNTAEGVKLKDVFDTILLKSYTKENVAKEVALGIKYGVELGTMITQTYTKIETKEKRLADGTVKKTPQGRTIGVEAYDPLKTILDWNAKPGKVSETSEFIIITIGHKSVEWVKKNYPSKAKDVLPRTTGEIMDAYKLQLETQAGMSRPNDSVIIREYYKTDGYRYLIANDEVLLSKTPVSNGTMGKIPIDVTATWLDNDSPYGRGIYNLLDPTIQVLSTVFNQIADSNALNIKTPFFALEGVLKQKGLTLNNFEANQIVELNPGLMGQTNKVSVRDLIAKFDFKDITVSAQFLFSEALNNIWYITGLNSTTLGGLQDKQIRNQAVADMISQSSLRNSSKIVRNLEIGFINPTCWHFVDIFEMYFEDFEDFQKDGVPKEFIENIKNIRVVNGSFLPSDQQTQIQKAGELLRIGMNNGSFDQEDIMKFYLKAMGFTNGADRFLIDPMEQVQMEQAVAQQRGAEQ